MKNVVITGSTRGIGFAMAMEFLKSGCRVTLSGRGDALPADAQAELRAFAGNYQYIPCNVQQRADLESLWAAAVQTFGSVDVWINNAGQNAPHAMIWETQERYVKNTVETNLLGVIYGAQVAAGGMLAQG